jgi:hypothetical protein
MTHTETIGCGEYEPNFERRPTTTAAGAESMLHFDFYGDPSGFGGN